VLTFENIQIGHRFRVDKEFFHYWSVMFESSSDSAAVPTVVMGVYTVVATELDSYVVHMTLSDHPKLSNRLSVVYGSPSFNLLEFLGWE